MVSEPWPSKVPRERARRTGHFFFSLRYATTDAYMVVREVNSPRSACVRVERVCVCFCAVWSCLRVLEVEIGVAKTLRKEDFVVEGLVGLVGVGEVTLSGLVEGLVAVVVVEED